MFMKDRYLLPVRIFMGLEGFYSFKGALIVEMLTFMKVGLLMDYLKGMEGRFNKMELFMKEPLGLDSKMVRALELRSRQIMRMTIKGLKLKRAESFNLAFFVEKFHDQVCF